MRLAHRITHAGLVWFTAVATLFAGVPHIDCLCPNGDHKSFCFGFSRSGTDCCATSFFSSSRNCKGCQAEATSATAQPIKRVCCEGKPQPNIEGSNPTSQVNGKCCQKTLVPGDSAVTTLAMTTVKQQLTVAFAVILPQVESFSWRPTAEYGFILRHSSRFLPPIDLVISLQHFLV